MRLKEIELRLSQIREEMKRDGADLDALNKECDSLLEERTKLIAEEQTRQAALNQIAAGVGIASSQPVVAPVQEQRTYDDNSAEYRSAFLKNLLGEDLTEQERAAFLHTTTNTGDVLPRTMLNKIWDLVSKEHSIMGDITLYRTGTILEVVKHTAIVQGKAAKKNEGVANDDEQNTFVKVTLSGHDFTKHVDISYAMAKMSIDSLESYLIKEISDSLGEAMADDVIAQIGTDMASANKVQTAVKDVVSFKDITSAFALLKRAGKVTVYATRATIYNHLAGMVDSTGRPIFQLNAQDGVEGTILGAGIKVEDSVADGVFLIGDASKVTYNMIQDIMIENDKDIKKHTITYSGYARGEGALIDPQSFVELTVKTTP